MKTRHGIRYSTTVLPTELTTATLIQPDLPSIEAAVVNISSLGIKLKIEVTAGWTLPKRNDIVTIRLTEDMIDFSGMCVWSASPEPSVFELALYFFKPHEQNYLHNLLSTLKLPLNYATPYEESFLSGMPVSEFVSHEWEELLDKLVHCENPVLREIGIREMNNLKGTETTITA